MTLGREAVSLDTIQFVMGVGNDAYLHFGCLGEQDSKDESAQRLQGQARANKYRRIFMTRRRCCIEARTFLNVVNSLNTEKHMGYTLCKAARRWPMGK